MRGFAVRIGIALAAAVIIPACGGSSGSGGGGLGLSGTSVSGKTINLNGGNASGAGGGQGGYLDIEGYVAGSVGVVSSGAINVSMSVPSPSKPFLGSNSITIAASGVLKIGTGNSTGGAAAFYLSNADSFIRLVSDNSVVTGVWVKSGVTLTLQPNAPTGAVAHTQAHIYVAEGWFIEGTVTTALRDVGGEGLADGTAKADLYFDYPYNFQMSAAGAIDLSGANNGAGAGANGGNADIRAYNVNSSGDIITRGGNGSSDGGNGGSIYFISDWGWMVNRGALTSEGGTGAAGTGGSGGTVDLYANDYSFLYNTGNVLSRGGNGTTGGGTGGDVYFYTGEADMINSGDMTTYGGNATASGNAGDGGYIYFYADYGEVRTLAKYDSHGGNATAGVGGSAGYCDFEGWNAYSYAGDYIPNNGGVYVGGQIIANGGNGTTGAGDGGYLYLYCDTSGYAATDNPQLHCLLVGYSTINKSGGNGTTGGYADYIGVWAYYTYDDVSVYYGAQAVNEANIVANGGIGSTGAGGSNNYCELETDDSIYPPYNYGVTNTGDITMNGGNGATTGGNAGYFYWWGDFFLKNSGKLTCNGGNGGTGVGGNGTNYIELYSTGPLTNSAAIAGNGGSSTAANGGSGGELYLYAPTVRNSASLTLDGGDSTAATGGSGGYMELFSDLAVTVTSGALSVAGGVGGAADGTIGDIYIDGAHTVGP